MSTLIFDFLYFRVYLEAQEDALSELLEIALIQSTEASNRIEGIVTTDEANNQEEEHKSKTSIFPLFIGIIILLGIVFFISHGKKNISKKDGGK